MKTPQDIRDYIDKRRKELFDDDLAIVIDTLLEKDEISLGLYYYAMEYLDKEMQGQIDAQDQHDMNKELEE